MRRFYGLPSVAGKRIARHVHDSIYWRTPARRPKLSATPTNGTIMRNVIRFTPSFLVLATVAITAGACAGGSSSTPEAGVTPGHAVVATGDFISFDGRKIGEAHLRQVAKGVRIHVEFAGLAPGVHAIHVHSVGACEPPFTTAAGHFNPAARKHGLHNPDGPHAGDLPNISLPFSGALRHDTITSAVSLLPGPNNLLDADGSSLVVHDGPDDYVSDPAGNSGRRIACATLHAGPER
jgi:Cu-Zn family superoxide dismutase